MKNAELWGLCAHPNKEECVTASEDGQVIYWNLETGKVVSNALIVVL